jgi:hypothetical protein
MNDYIHEDFNPKLIEKTNIQIVSNILDADIPKAHILIIPATQQNIDVLVQMSYEAPFMRVIIDDFTSMVGIDSFRQILASSTIFVSGSGFNRDFGMIPASYYTLKFMPVNMISLVGKPEETFEGVFRDNIATMELMGNNCEFNQYEFVTKCEEYSQQKFHTIPSVLYPILVTQPKINHYMSLMFILQNIEKIKTSVTRLEQDLKSKKINEANVEYYLKWKKIVEDAKNPLYTFIYDKANVSGNSSSTIVLQKCMNCNEEVTQHLGYGCISCCCGAFYCSNCLESMATYTLYDSETNIQVQDKENYYCCVCRVKNPKFYVNQTKKRDKNIYAFALIEEYFEDYDKLKSHLKVDYYFYMFINGLIPRAKKGKPLNIHNDIIQKIVSVKDLQNNKIPRIDSLLPKDQLAINTIQVINNVLSKLNIMPKRNSIILFYACPKYMEARVLSQFRKIIKLNPIETQHSATKQQPISTVDIMFKNSVASLIGMHKNIIAIVLWKRCETQDNSQQMLGRCMRLNTFNTPLYFYITATNSDFN